MDRTQIKYGDALISTLSLMQLGNIPHQHHTSSFSQLIEWENGFLVRISKVKAYVASHRELFLGLIALKCKLEVGFEFFIGNDCLPEDFFASLFSFFVILHPCPISVRLERRSDWKTVIALIKLSRETGSLRWLWRCIHRFDQRVAWTCVPAHGISRGPKWARKVKLPEILIGRRF